MLQINNKFEVGQEVYIIQKVRVKEDCPACNGEGHIIIDGNRFSCVTCYGTGRLHGQKKTHEVIGKKVIIKIKTYTYRNNGVGEMRTEVKYIFENGYEFTDAKLFLTEGEANAECDRLNNKNAEEC